MPKLKYFKKVYWVIIPFLVFFILLTFFNIYYSDKNFPNIEVAGIYVGGKTIQQTEVILAQNVNVPQKINLLAKDKNYELELSDVGFAYDFFKSADSAFNIYRSGQFFSDIYMRPTSLISKKNINLVTGVDEQKLNEYLQVISKEVATEPLYPSIIYKDKQVQVNKGLAGKEVDTVSLKRIIEEKLSQKDFSSIQIPFKSVDPSLSQDEANKLMQRAQKFIGKSFNLIFEDETLKFEQESLFDMIGPKEDFSENAILEFIDKEVTPKVNREPQNAVFRFEEERVVEFLPAKDGVSIDTNLLKNQIIETLTNLSTSDEKVVTIEIPVQKASPKITTEEVNNLGIRELLGRGVSKFRGSIPSRIHNISLASSHFNGVLMEPGADFSFNETLGDVSEYTGYKQAYIIKDGRTVLGDGGGVCQVSTTLFRALLSAGLPIIERRAHSYRVGYYEQDSPPGIDATVFSPTTDLKFKNDTPGHLLIQTQTIPQTSTLIFEIYGTSDGRISTTTKPVVSGVTPPPEDLYVDDPGLPIGVVKQIDYKAWGAKATFNYKVERGGEVIFEKTFVSNYRPWQAVYLKGTGQQQ